MDTSPNEKLLKKGGRMRIREIENKSIKRRIGYDEWNAILQKSSNLISKNESPVNIEFLELFMTSKQVLVIKMIYQKKETLASISSLLNISITAVTKIRDRALVKIGKTYLKSILINTDSINKLST